MTLLDLTAQFASVIAQLAYHAAERVVDRKDEVSLSVI
jgi:hypothetical protein